MPLVPVIVVPRGFIKAFMASCGYSSFVGDACGPSSFNPANVACVAISDCKKDVRSHLVYCKISDDSGVDSEAKLLLSRAGKLLGPYRLYNSIITFSVPFFCLYIFGIQLLR